MPTHSLASDHFYRRTTQPSDTPGVRRARRRWAARVAMGGRWVHLGLFVSEWQAARVARVARDLKRAGAFARCRTCRCIREVVRVQIAA